jgi:hypothetical protein
MKKTVKILIGVGIIGLGGITCLSLWDELFPYDPGLGRVNAFPSDNANTVKSYDVGMTCSIDGKPLDKHIESWDIDFNSRNQFANNMETCHVRILRLSPNSGYEFNYFIDSEDSIENKVRVIKMDWPQGILDIQVNNIDGALFWKFINGETPLNIAIRFDPKTQKILSIHGQKYEMDFYPPAHLTNITYDSIYYTKEVKIPFNLRGKEPSWKKWF